MRSFKVSSEHHPWEQGQCVVGFSRSPSLEYLGILSDKDINWVVEHLYGVLCKQNQWTEYMENLINEYSIGPGKNGKGSFVLDIPKVYPFRISDYNLPRENDGYVYMLVSFRSPQKVYIGQTQNLYKRVMCEHNKGKGSGTTSLHEDLPWGVAAYMANLGWAERHILRELERAWQIKNKRSKEAGEAFHFNIIQNGRDVMNEFNSKQDDCSHHVKFVITMNARPPNQVNTSDAIECQFCNDSRGERVDSTGISLKRRPQALDNYTNNRDGITSVFKRRRDDTLLSVAESRANYDESNASFCGAIGAVGLVKMCNDFIYIFNSRPHIHI